MGNAYRNLCFHRFKDNRVSVVSNVRSSRSRTSRYCELGRKGIEGHNQQNSVVGTVIWVFLQLVFQSFQWKILVWTVSQEHQNLLKTTKNNTKLKNKEFVFLIIVFLTTSMFILARLVLFADKTKYVATAAGKWWLTGTRQCTCPFFTSRAGWPNN